MATVRVTITSYNGYVYEQFLAAEVQPLPDPHGVAEEQIAGRIVNLIAAEFNILDDDSKEG